MFQRQFAYFVLKLAMLAAALLAGRPAPAGTGRQTTTFLVDADERTVCRWIEQNSRALDESTGAQVVSVGGRRSRLRTQTKEGSFTVVVEHGPLRDGKFQTVLLKSEQSTLVAEQTEIRVDQEGNVSRITITVVATVSNHSPMAISLGIRPSLRGMRKLLEERFGSPNAP